MNALVLGVNGVVLTSEKARDVFRRKSVEYVAHKTGECAANARILESHAKSMYGNVAIGLKAFRPDLKISNAEYASFVYDDRVIDEALAAADSDPAFARDKYYAASFFEEVAASGCPAFLFTGASRAFVEALLERMDVSHLVDATRVFACDTVQNSHALAKSSDLSFVAVDYAVRTRCGRGTNVLFVDGNLGTVMQASRAGLGWASTHFDHEKQRLVECVKFFIEQ